MSRYQYRAVDPRGKIVTGETSAVTTSQAIAKLEQQGLQVQSISLIDVSKEHFDSLSPAQQQAIEQLRVQAVRNAQAWSQPMLAFSQEIKSRQLSSALLKLSAKLQQVTHVEQLARDQDTAEIMPFVIKEPVASSATDGWLAKFSQQNSRRDFLYPLVSVILLSLILAGIATWIVPVFQQMFNEFSLNLPLPTRLVFAVSHWIYPNALLSLAVLTVVVWLLVLTVRTLRTSRRVIQHFPILTSGDRAGLKAIGVLAQNTAELADMQYPQTQALRLAAEGCNHSGYQAIALRLADEIETAGQPHSSQTRTTMPPLLLDALSTETVNVAALRMIGQMYRDREQYRSRQWIMTLSQLIIVGTGLIVGFVVFALFMPLIKMVTSLA